MGKSQGKKRERSVEDDAPKLDDGNQQQSHPSKKARLESKKSIFVRCLPPNATAETLTDFFSEHFPVKHALVVTDPKTKQSRGYGFVTFTDADDAIKAKVKCGNILLEGRRLRLDIAEPRHRNAVKSRFEQASRVLEEKRKREEALAEARKPAKLIIRNLPWSIKTQQQLSTLFRSYGKIRFADLPKSSRGRLAGFGFVTLRARKNAEKAMLGLNGKVVDGRTLAVDWAVDKETWEQHKEGSSEPAILADSVSSKNYGSDIGDGIDGEEMTEEEADVANFMKNHMENLEDEGDDSEDGEEASSVTSDDDGDDGTSQRNDATKVRQQTDNSSVLFIRNLPYNTDDEELKAHFSQFGRVRYARVVTDREIEKPAGTGFVCFAKIEDSKACLRNAPHHRPNSTLAKRSVLQDANMDPDGRYTLQGRVLQVSQAVDKDEAAKFSQGPCGRKSQEKDKRRLFLLSEGTIPSGSKLYDLLTPSEVKMREASAKTRKKQLQSNPSLRLSLSRLAIRNIPRNIGQKGLKALARSAVVGFAKDVKEGKREPLSKEETVRGGQEDREAEHRRKEKGRGVVTQAKIVFETKNGSKVAEGTEGAGSRGYGFIEYSSHRWALMGLRWLNGRPVQDETGRSLRLIVEFAVENAQVVHMRKARSRPPRASK